MRAQTHFTFVAAMLAIPGSSATARAFEDPGCAIVRANLLPVRRSVGRDYPALADGFQDRRRYVYHDFDFTRLAGAHATTFVFFHGWARYEVSRGRPVTEQVIGRIASAGQLEQREWQATGALSDASTNGTLQSDPVVSAVSAVLAYMALGPALDVVLDRSPAIPIPDPIIRGSSGFRYWYTCQGCIRGARFGSRQSLRSARFAQHGGETFVITTRPKMIAARIAPSGQVLKYFRCAKPIA